MGLPEDRRLHWDLTGQEYMISWRDTVRSEHVPVLENFETVHHVDRSEVPAVGIVVGIADLP